MCRIGRGELVVMNRSTADGRPLQFTWRQTRYQVADLESISRPRHRLAQHDQGTPKTFRITTTSGFRCTLSQPAENKNWRMERVLNRKGA